MKQFKRLLSCLLAGATAISMMFVGTVSAGAEKISPYMVDMDANSYANKLIYTIWLSEAQCEIWNNPDSYSKTCKDGHKYGIRLDLVLEDGKNSYKMSAIRWGENISWWFYENDKSVDNVLGVTSAEWGWEYGIAFYIPLDSPYASKLKKCKDIYGINCMVFASNEKNCPLVHADKEKGDLNYGPVSAFRVFDENSTSYIPGAKCSAISDKSYTGKAIKPAVTVTDFIIKEGKNRTLKNGVDYTVAYSDNVDIGYGVATIKGKGDYTGQISVNYRIVPKKTTLKVKKSGNKAVLSWDKIKGAEKYEIYCSTNGGKYKKISTLSGSKTSYTVSKLDFKKNTYKFKIRSYAKSDGEIFYSPYSSAVNA